LARVAASQGRRVILVDANLAAPAIAPLAGCRGVGAGLVEVLTGRVPLSRALLRDVRSGALLLSPSQPRGDALRVLKSAQLQKMIAHLRGVSDLLLIHAGPTLASGGLPFLARQVDAVMLVARADVVPRPAVAAAVDMLAAIPAPPIGMVLAA
jgi:Mrp family chromosome partitioning ATPase